MAKRSKQQTMYQPSQQLKRRPPAGKSTTGRAAANKSTSQPVSKPARSGAARSYSRPIPSVPRLPAGINLRIIRIVAVVVALVAVIGGTAWALSLKGAYGANEVAGLIILGFLAGLGIAVAMRTEDIVTRAAMYLKRRK